MIVFAFHRVLPYSLKTDIADVCLFVPDLIKGTKVDHEPTIEHYQGVLQKHGVTGISQVCIIVLVENYFYSLKCVSYIFGCERGMSVADLP